MSSPLNDPQVEQWFQRFNAPLKRLSAEERAELHDEVRQHLDALVAANEELGSSPQEAWEHALTQFGDPARIGKRLAWEWRRGKGWVSPDMAAVLYGLGITTAAFFGVTLAVYASWLAVYPSHWATFVNEHSEAVFGNAYLAVVPVLLGSAVGRRHPKQALTGAFYSAALLPVLPAMTLMEAVCIFGHERVGVTLGINLMLFVFGGIWLLLSTGAAYLASARRHRHWYRPALTDFKLTLPGGWLKPRLTR